MWPPVSYLQSVFTFLLFNNDHEQRLKRYMQHLSDKLREACADYLDIHRFARVVFPKSIEQVQSWNDPLVRKCHVNEDNSERRSQL